MNKFIFGFNYQVHLRVESVIFYLVLAIVILPESAHAYIGPGVGAGAFAVVFGVLASIFLAVVAILWYPFKRLVKKFKQKKEKPSAGEE